MVHFHVESRAFIIIIRIITLAALLAAPTIVRGQERDDCIVVRVDQPMVFPDGSMHEAGTLRLCTMLLFSPVGAIHRASVNGRPVCMLRSRRAAAELGSTGQPAVLFHRLSGGHLRLVGFVRPYGAVARSYEFQSTPRNDHSVIARGGLSGS